MLGSLLVAGAAACDCDRTPSILWPRDHANGVPTDTVVAVEDADRARSIALTDATGGDVPVARADGGSFATFRPAAPLAPATTYEVVVVDDFGTHRARFTTGTAGAAPVSAPPHVTAVTRDAMRGDPSECEPTRTVDVRLDGDGAWFEVEATTPAGDTAVATGRSDVSFEDGCFALPKAVAERGTWRARAYGADGLPTAWSAPYVEGPGCACDGAAGLSLAGALVAASLLRVSSSRGSRALA